MAGSSNDFISRNRKPRVHITYKIANDGATPKKEIPFIMGVMANLSGKPKQALAPVAEREFKNLDTDNFDKFLEAQNPRVAFTVADKLGGGKDDEISVDIEFKRMKDFDPVNVAKNVPVLREMLNQRERLEELLKMADGKPKVDSLLNELCNNPDLQAALAEKLTK